MSENKTVDYDCNAVLAQPCPYKEPPLYFIGGHKFCPCISKAIRTAYVGGYTHGKLGVEPEVGIETLDPKDVE